MSTSVTATTTFLLLLLLFITSTTTISCTTQERLALQAAKRHISKTKGWIQASITTFDVPDHDRGANEAALRECVKLYEDSESRLSELLGGENYTRGDARTWLSGVLANHRTCFDEFGEEGLANSGRELASNLTSLVGEALALFVNMGSVERGNICWTTYIMLLRIRFSRFMD